MSTKEQNLKIAMQMVVMDAIEHGAIEPATLARYVATKQFEEQVEKYARMLDFINQPLLPITLSEAETQLIADEILDAHIKDSFRWPADILMSSEHTIRPYPSAESTDEDLRYEDLDPNK